MHSYQPSPAQLISFSEQELMEKAVSANHPFRKLNQLINLDKIARSYRKLYSKTGAKGLPVEKALRALVIQFLEDYSDRQLERALEENLAVKWFVGFELGEATPDHSFFGKFRDRLGSRNLEAIFNTVNSVLEEKGLIGSTFHFIDASGIITKSTLWAERDQAIKAGEEKLNNQNVKRYAKDPDATYGCKGKDKFWFGHKRTVRVDMSQGLITKVVTTTAKLTDAQVLVQHPELIPDKGLVIADKGYDTAEAQGKIKEKTDCSGIIQKNNRKTKNRDKDRFLSKLRMPFEGVFSKNSKRARYRGLLKVHFQVLAESIAHNLKRLIVIGESISYQSG